MARRRCRLRPAPPAAAVRHRAGEGDAGHAARDALGGRPLGAIADQHGAESTIAGGMQSAPTTLDRWTTPCQVRNAPANTPSMRSAIAREGGRAAALRPEVIDVGAPFDLEHLVAIDPRRQDLGARRDEEIRRPAHAVAPPPHRLHDQRAIETGFGDPG